MEISLRNTVREYLTRWFINAFWTRFGGTIAMNEMIGNMTNNKSNGFKSIQSVNVHDFRERTQNHNGIQIKSLWNHYGITMDWNSTSNPTGSRITSNISRCNTSFCFFGDRGDSVVLVPSAFIRLSGDQKEDWEALGSASSAFPEFSDLVFNKTHSVWTRIIAVDIRANETAEYI